LRRIKGMSKRDEVIRGVAELLAGLAVPVSLGMPPGTAREAWSSVHGQLVGLGWYDADQYEAALREALAEQP
jgi:hypothetical protein